LGKLLFAIYIVSVILQTRQILSFLHNEEPFISLKTFYYDILPTFQTRYIHVFVQLNDFEISRKAID